MDHSSKKLSNNHNFDCTSSYTKQGSSQKQKDLSKLDLICYPLFATGELPKEEGYWCAGTTVRLITLIVCQFLQWEKEQNRKIRSLHNHCSWESKTKKVQQKIQMFIVTVHLFWIAQLDHLIPTTGHSMNYVVCDDTNGLFVFGGYTGPNTLYVCNNIHNVTTTHSEMNWTHGNWIFWTHFLFVLSFISSSNHILLLPKYKFKISLEELGICLLSENRNCIFMEDIQMKTTFSGILLRSIQVFLLIAQTLEKVHQFPIKCCAWQFSVVTFEAHMLKYNSIVSGIERRWSCGFYFEREDKFFVHGGWNTSGPLGDIILFDFGSFLATMKQLYFVLCCFLWKFWFEFC